MYIVILSSEGDQSTSDVIDWLLCLNTNYIRYNETSIIDVCYKNNNIQSNLILTCNNSVIAYNDIKSFWYRRSNFNIKFPSVKFDPDFPLKKDISVILKNEVRKIRELIHYKLNTKRSLGSFSRTDINKMIAIESAQNNGINIPNTLITNSKKELLNFKKECGNIICKPISEALLFSDSNIGNIYNYTHEVNDYEIEQLPDFFTMSLFQKEIRKKYELRIFYLDTEFYCMAIFSQQDKQTSTDFRKYNHNNPNRNVPFNLPDDIKMKLSKLMSDLDLNTGSIDMAVDEDNKYIFFEVNPVGQFGMTSSPCNYFLDKKIANFLVKDHGK